MKNEPIHVFIVDDSRVSRDLLTHIIEADTDLAVMGHAVNGIEALRWLEVHTPDVITMDVQMPIMNGFEATRKIMETKPVPIIIITSAYTPPNAQMAFDAMDAGALAILEKPTSFGDKNYFLQAEEIIKTIKISAGVKLIKKRRLPSFLPTKTLSVFEKPKGKIEAIAIGASLGGPPAIAEILSQLPPLFPIPIFIVQHISVGFIPQFVVWLQERCALPIHLAIHGEKALPGHIYMAPDKFHMEISHGGVIILNPSHNHGPQPSVNRLFHSMALVYGPHAIGVILTGMGKDGAEELLLMRQKGAYTIAQSQDSCVMFGMPREAIAIGAAKQVIPLERIASTLIYLTQLPI